MREKRDFITNSSSTNFIITNKTKEEKTLVDFVKENPHLIQQFAERYDYSEETHNQDLLIKSASGKKAIIKPGDNSITFGDEDGTLIGHVFDYILRDGGESKSFSWKFNKYYR